MLSLLRTHRPSTISRRLRAPTLGCRPLLLTLCLAIFSVSCAPAFGQAIQPTAAASFDGSLIKAQNQTEIYYVHGGLKHWISNGNWLRGHRRLMAAGIKVVSPAIVDSIPSGIPFSYVPPSETRLTAILAVLAFGFLIFVLKFRGRVQQFLAKPVDCCGNDYSFRGVLLAILAFCVVLRSLPLLVHPRFWAEEGVIWFQYAVQHSA
ncbi:MAG TPA: hypothetical protein VJ848_02965, partial [Candidatus Angelobacter sp.]|nr:hypothetical protein [Candidatus Angelobacter sp.]